MSGVITWKNVQGSTGHSDAARILESAQKSIDSGIAGIGKLMSDRYDHAVDTNTDAYQNAVAGMSLEELQSDAGRAKLAQMLSGFGNKVDHDVTRGLLEERTNTLLDRAYQQTQRDRAGALHDLNLRKGEATLANTIQDTKFDAENQIHTREERERAEKARQRQDLLRQRALEVSTTLNGERQDLDASFNRVLAPFGATIDAAGNVDLSKVSEADAPKVQELLAKRQSQLPTNKDVISRMSDALAVELGGFKPGELEAFRANSQAYSDPYLSNDQKARFSSLRTDNNQKYNATNNLFIAEKDMSAIEKLEKATAAMDPETESWFNDNQEFQAKALELLAGTHTVKLPDDSIAKVQFPSSAIAAVKDIYGKEGDIFSFKPKEAAQYVFEKLNLNKQYQDYVTWDKTDRGITAAESRAANSARYNTTGAADGIDAMEKRFKAEALAKPKDPGSVSSSTADQLKAANDAIQKGVAVGKDGKPLQIGDVYMDTSGLLPKPIRIRNEADLKRVAALQRG